MEYIGVAAYRHQQQLTATVHVRSNCAGTSLEATVHEMTARVSESEAHLKETLEKVSLELYDKIVFTDSELRTEMKRVSTNMANLDTDVAERLTLLDSKLSNNLDERTNSLQVCGH